MIACVFQIIILPINSLSEGTKAYDWIWANVSCTLVWNTKIMNTIKATFGLMSNRLMCPLDQGISQLWAITFVVKHIAKTAKWVVFEWWLFQKKV